MVIDITGLEKHKVLKALYNNAKPLGMGVLDYDPKPMTEDEAKELLESSKNKYFDYIKGRPLKISLADDNLDTDLYDRDNPAAVNAIKWLKEAEGLSGMDTAMVFDSGADLDKKEKDWKDIFIEHPSLSDKLIEIKDEYGSRGLSLLLDFIVDQFIDYANECKES